MDGDACNANPPEAHGSEDALRGFYGRVLGLQEVTKPPVLAARGGCWFRGYGIELHFGVDAIVTLATEPATAGTGRYIDRFGPVPW